MENKNENNNAAQRRWNKVYGSFSKKPVYDGWLDKHADILNDNKGEVILDIGCGSGNNSLFLSENGFNVIACDYSDNGLSIIRDHAPNVETRCLNFSVGMPFSDCFTSIIIADLSLHYFYWEKTNEILDDLFRVLKPNGYCFCRVNSIKDIHYGAGKGIVLEENFYENEEGITKRFFDERSVIELFKDRKIIHMEEYRMNRFTHEKVLWEVVVKNCHAKADSSVL